MMVSSPRWTILVATLGQRRARLRRLLDTLLPQLDAAAGEVTVCALYNHGERPLGHVRHALLRDASSTYVSFVDDDDEVPEYFVDEALQRMDGVVDYVGWRMQCYVDGRAVKPTYHSLRYTHWWDDLEGYYRDVSHLNPVRTELARCGDFRRGTPPEDVAWVDQVRGHLKTEAYVDKVMYHYHSSSVDSTWRGHGVVRPATTRYDLSHPYFSYHSESSE
jgi:hypothetical protein